MCCYILFLGAIKLYIMLCNEFRILAYSSELEMYMYTLAYITEVLVCYTMVWKIHVSIHHMKWTVFQLGKISVPYVIPLLIVASTVLLLSTQHLQKSLAVPVRYLHVVAIKH